MEELLESLMKSTTDEVNYKTHPNYQGIISLSSCIYDSHLLPHI